MPGPWDNWEPRSGPHNRAARALARVGAKITIHRDGGTGMKPVSEYLYDCGCRRVYVADLRATREQEIYVPCTGHRNLLTPEGEQGTLVAGPTGKAPEQQETDR